MDTTTRTRIAVRHAERLAAVAFCDLPWVWQVADVRWLARRASGRDGRRVAWDAWGGAPTDSGGRVDPKPGCP